MAKIELPNAARHSIHKALEKGPSFDPGQYGFEGRVILDVLTEVKKGQPSEYVPTVKLPWMRILVASLARMGFQRDAIIAEILKTANELKNMDKEQAEAFDVHATAAEKLFNERVRSQLAKATRQGATTWKGTVDVVEVVAK